MPYLRGPFLSILRPVHYFAIFSAVLLTGLLFWLVPTTPPSTTKNTTTQAASQHNDVAGMPEMHEVEPASIDSIIAASKALLPKHALAEINAIEKQIAEQKDSAAMAPLFEQASAIWMKHKQGPMVAWTKAKAAHLARSEKKLNFAGQFFLDLMQDAHSAEMRTWEAQGAVQSLEEALQLNPDNDTTKLALAAAYIEGTGAPMRGIGILREMVAKNPDHIPANLMLGRFSIQSGQYDKAVARLEHVLELEPENREALYFLAEAQKGKGDKEAAIKTFRKLEGIVNKPDFTNDIEEYIKSFK